ncbi:glutamine-hydrolyzing GMP synthase [Treponema ruminis]|uniref:GMP synthase (glutamine-hydrolyzing) n=1 Tax=Treponema ruminis TaxID=744515 RepID=A0A7W8LMA8_9SPIR|nr:glutamine-hydrolyzing GMP synthase [Treponema ruminis]MBB5226324.1 GMP synthase (glutamine-hydrolyzing) [Treponema ruminis]QSI02771.1 glutamine-hydrolyzing GMP synthase [Treponema ruminis]
MNRSKIVVLDFGSQYAHLIAKRFRALGFYSEIALPSADLSVFEGAKGVVFSGGPASVYDEKTPDFNSEILNLDIPILGLCYGHYIVQLGYNGKVGKADVGEFGFAELNFSSGMNGSSAKCPLFKGIEGSQQVWMSHQDGVLQMGEGFEAVGSTKDCPFAATQNLSKKRFSLQFHCEVKDTPCGNEIFKNFAEYCGMTTNWDEDTVLAHILDTIKKDARDKNVLLFLSGGVDSTVAFALLNKALGQERVLGLHIDNGFMRKNESKSVAEAYKKFGFNNFIVEDASESFLGAISGLTDPQKKRMAVGENFITVRDRVVAAQKLNEDDWMLAQGTLYPDIIESGGTKNSHTIKTHHNRVDGIQKLIAKGLIIEPLKDLYKDEVRAMGKKLGLDDQLVMRHPFPGPGLSINVLCSDGSFTDKDKEELAKAQEELNKVKIDQFCADCTASMSRSVLPVRSVGVQGDFRTYRFPACLTFKSEGEGFYHIPHIREKVEGASSSITNGAAYLNRTVIKLYQKPGLKDEDLKLQEGYCDRRRLDQLREVDNIVLTELHSRNLYNSIFQHLTIDLPYASTKENASFVLRPVCSEDVMTARFAWFPMDVFKEIVRKIAELPFVDALYFDATNKPPATFGWE